MIKIRGLVKNTEVKGREVPVLNDVTFSLPKQGLIVLTGSDRLAIKTLLRVIAGLSEFDSGEVIVNDNALAEMTEQERDLYRNTDLGIIFRDSKLRPEMTVYRCLELALNIQDWEDKKAEDTRERIHAILEAAALEEFEAMPISKLSKTGRRLVMIARALVKDPKIVLAEEPTADLEEDIAKEVMTTLKEASKTRLVIVATEEPKLASRYADHKLCAENGQFVEEKRISVGSIMPPDDLSESITVGEKRKNTRESEKILPQRYDVKARKLPVRDRIRLSGMFRKERKGLVFMVILALVAALLLVYCACFDANKILKGYFEKYQPETLTGVVKVTDASDDDSWTKDINRGSYYLDRVETLAQETGHPLIPTVQTWATHRNRGEATNTRCDITLAAITETQQAAFPVTEGHFPENYTQIAITDYMAGELGVSLGDDIMTSLGRLSVCGIISTDHAEYGLAEKLTSQRNGDFASYFLKYRYAIGVMRKEAFVSHMEYQDYLELPYVLPFGGETPAAFLNKPVSDGVVGALSLLQEDQFRVGRMPEKPNEVLVSANMAWMYDISSKMNEGEAHYNFLDIHDPDYHEYYSSYLSMAEFFPDGITVVGVYSDDVSADYLIADEIFEKICERHLDYYYFDEYLLDCSDMTDYTALLKSAEKLDIRFKEPYAEGVYYIKDTLHGALPVVWAIAGFLGIIAILVLESYFRVTTRTNVDYIADLRILGVTRKDISKIFTVNALDIALTCVVLTTLLSLGVMAAFNLLFASELSERYCNVLTWTLPMTLLLVGVAVVILVMNRVIVKRKMQAVSKESV